MQRKIQIIGAPVQSGAGRGGCLMGPAALRTAGLVEALSALGCDVRDAGDISPLPVTPRVPAAAPVRGLAETLGWIEAVREAARGAASAGRVPLILGGDHSLSAGSVTAMAAHARDLGRPLFVLWLDAHSDLHGLDTTETGNLHGCPLAYATGFPGFDAFPEAAATVPAERVALIGLRSVDAIEKERLAEHPFCVSDMRALDEQGVIAPLKAFLARVEAENGLLHVSLDVDFLDPAIAPAVGTTVPGGATFREAHLIMEFLHDCGRVSSLDLVELNPFLDDRGRTAHLLCDLAASLFGRTVLSRPTRSYA